MMYQITASAFQSFEDDFQYLAIGLIDGGLVVIDLQLGIEKHFLEKHPTEVTALAFHEDKALLTGSKCGMLAIHDIENLDK